MHRKERRRVSRTSSNVPLDLYDPTGHAIIGEGRFINVSQAGSLLESRQTLRLNQHIRLQVQSPASSSFEFAGKIIWRKKKANGFTYGIRFKPLSAVHVLKGSSTPAYSHLYH